ncbi:MAG: GGDEF domain-containing protein [Desulfovibrio sp.]|nr:GGDEF domain-containing protein [Desulfovibrio sp.]
MSNRIAIKGPRISVVNLAMFCLSFLIFIVVLYTTVLISRDYRAALTAMNNYMDWEAASRAIQYGTDYLAEQAQTYAITLNKQCADHYFEELYDIKNRETALERLMDSNLHFSSPDHDCDLERAVNLSNALSRKEIYAIRLIAEACGESLEDFPDAVRNTRLSGKDRLLSPPEKIARARAMVFDHSYEDARREIHDLLSKFVRSNIEKLRNEQTSQTRNLGEALRYERILLIALFVINLLTFALIIIYIIRPLKVYLRCIKDDKKLKVIGAYEFKQLALTYNDIFALKEYHDKMLKHKAEHDPLTGLLNRSAFDSLKDILKGDDYHIGLLLIDVDKFKQINDNYGHMIGDETLRNVANMLNSNFRSEDYCIRLGGDEFAVVFQAGDDSMIDIIKEKIYHINEKLLHPEGKLPPVSLSAGGAISKTGFAENLYLRADEALYSVKEAGRRGCEFYDENLAEAK